MPLEDVLDDAVRLPEQVRRPRVLHRVGVEPRRARRHVLLPQAGDVPHPEMG